METESTQELSKLFYTIGEVAEMFDVNASLIRYWEKEFSILRPKKNKKGNRLFTPKDIENIRLIYHLVKERGMTLKGAQQKLRENKDDTVDNFELVKMLQDIRTDIVSLKESIELS